MTGLTNANTAGMLTALEEYFLVSGEGSDTPIRVEYDLDELPCPTEKLIADCTEDLGSADVNSEVDLTLDELFTTSNEESIIDPYGIPAAEATKYEFDQGDPVMNRTLLCGC